MKQGWEYKKLGEVCHITMGQSPDGNSINDNEGVEFHQGKTCFGEQTLGVSNLFSNAPVKLAEAHSVLLCVRAPVGYPNITERKICIGRGLCALYAKEDIDNKFLFYSLLSKQSHFEKNATGSTFKAISSKVVSNTEIPIPPKSTQLAIVSELDKINELIRIKKEQLKDYDNLAQSIFYEMFGDPVENDKGFDTKRLDEVFPLITDGTHQTPTYTEDRENGYKFLSAKDVTSGSINWNNVKFIPAWLHDNLSKRLKPQKNDILLCKNGTTGICALVEDDDTFDIYVSLALLRPNNLHNPKYLTYAINSPATKRQFDDSLKGIGVPNLHLKEIRRTIIIIPPLPLQQLFAQRIEQIERQKSAVAKAITDLETLLASRMQHWFE
jgi:type I restriction enzyme S subunit